MLVPQTATPRFEKNTGSTFSFVLQQQKLELGQESASTPMQQCRPLAAPFVSVMLDADFPCVGVMEAVENAW